jgi:hypothetical protein
MFLLLLGFIALASAGAGRPPAPVANPVIQTCSTEQMAKLWLDAQCSEPPFWHYDQCNIVGFTNHVINWDIEYYFGIVDYLCKASTSKCKRTVKVTQQCYTGYIDIKVVIDFTDANTWVSVTTDPTIQQAACDLCGTCDTCHPPSCDPESCWGECRTDCPYWFSKGTPAIFGCKLGHDGKPVSQESCSLTEEQYAYGSGQIIFNFRKYTTDPTACCNATTSAWDQQTTPKGQDAGKDIHARGGGYFNARSEMGGVPGRFIVDQVQIGVTPCGTDDSTACSAGKHGVEIVKLMPEGNYEQFVDAFHGQGYPPASDCHASKTCVRGVRGPVSERYTLKKQAFLKK